MGNYVLQDFEHYSALADAATARDRVARLTHSFYRYPARFGDKFVCEAIARYSRPGEVVLDPFCGGGTTAVEALVSGRRFVGSDVSPLALMVARCKTDPLSDAQLKRVRDWIRQVACSTQQHLRHDLDATHPNLVALSPWHAKLLVSLKDSTRALPQGPTRNFATCLLLRTSQWSLDGRQTPASPSEMIRRLEVDYREMSHGMREFVRTAASCGINKADLLRNRSLVQTPAAGLTNEKLKLQRGSVSLVVTSPPYLGVHVLYNKWQVGGRRETRAPYFLAGVDDIGGASAYTIIDRRSRNHQPYFEEITNSFKAVQRLLRRDAYVIQLVSFNNAEQSLPKYLEAMSAAGLRLCESYVRQCGELTWRDVPSRRWYARVKAIDDSSASKEVLLVHRNQGE